MMVATVGAFPVFPSIRYPGFFEQAGGMTDVLFLYNQDAWRYFFTQALKL